MNTISIVPDGDEQDSGQFRAVSGSLQSVGRTMGEALDALAAQIPDTDASALILIQQRRPDPFFTAEQYQRMRDLMARRDTLTSAERVELEALVDAELDGTVARTDALVRQLAP